MYGYREKGIQAPMALGVPINHLGDEVDPDQLVVNTELSLTLGRSLWQRESVRERETFHASSQVFCVLY